MKIPVPFAANVPVTISVAMILALSACSDGGPKSSAPVREMYRLNKLADFEFQEVNARGITRQDMLGKVWLAATVFTSCMTHCPVMCREMNKLQDEFAEDADFRMMTVTVDPARDNIDVLANFAKAYYAKPDRWYFVRHPDRAVTRKFVVDGLQIPWNDKEPLMHSYSMVLVDREGVVRGFYKQNDRDAMKALRVHIRKLLDETSKS